VCLTTRAVRLRMTARIRQCRIERQGQNTRRGVAPSRQERRRFLPFSDCSSRSSSRWTSASGLRRPCSQSSTVRPDRAKRAPNVAVSSSSAWRSAWMRPGVHAESEVGTGAIVASWSFVIAAGPHPIASQYWLATRLTATSDRRSFKLIPVAIDRHSPRTVPGPRGSRLPIAAPRARPQATAITRTVELVAASPRRPEATEGCSTQQTARRHAWR
jgi:hypothetical protein